ncbi:hypothetical protein [Desulfallas thermosapovorans]|uniref:Uncharacterized protein n=1 Tax=Desulfallas thermosapovorans DSM 6562 TaxID=1121431 RepID=A0A5S4ZR88_9FIRM|nr:hypothetical protein [Desulfallas thermosapovorans]TYO95133.1 hypothetical protein LX24_01862 [Desulfallas thermosapovorans DSM 6562]
MPTDDQMIKDIFGGDTGDPAPNNDNDPELKKAPEQDPDTPPEEPEQDPEPEKLYAGKYKTVEELEAAYKEAERGFHNDRQEKAELKRQLDELKAMLTPKPKEQDPKEYREKLIERLMEAPDEVVTELAEQIADRKLQERLGPVMPVIQQQIVNNQVQQFMSAVPDAVEYANDMAAILQAKPDLINQPGWLEKAYMQAKIARLEAKVSKATGDDKAAQAAAAKQAAAMPKGGKGEPPKPETEEEKMRKAIFGDFNGKRKMFDF